MSDLLEFFSRHPEVAKEMYYWGSEIVDDFDDYGPVIQSNEVGEYDDSTAFGRLRIVRDAIIRALEAGASDEGGDLIPPFSWRVDAGTTELP